MCNMQGFDSMFVGYLMLRQNSTTIKPYFQKHASKVTSCNFTKFESHSDGLQKFYFSQFKRVWDEKKSQNFERMN